MRRLKNFDGLDQSKDAAFDARIIGDFLDQARADNALDASGHLHGLTPAMHRFVLSAVVHRAHAHRLGLPGTLPPDVEADLDKITAMHALARAYANGELPAGERAAS